MLREREREKPQYFYDLTSEMVFHPSICILLVRIKSLKPILGTKGEVKFHLLKGRTSENLWMYFNNHYNLRIQCDS
jgi:hypothetical protein